MQDFCLGRPHRPFMDALLAWGNSACCDTRTVLTVSTQVLSIETDGHRHIDNKTKGQTDCPTDRWIDKYIDGYMD